jgi:Glycosyl transferases group 1
MRVAVIADSLTTSALQCEFPISRVSLHFNPWVYFSARPDFLFVESAWQGCNKSWKYKIAAYPAHANRNNSQLRRLVDRVRSRGIPTVFWNKEDGVHFDRFIDSASLFDVVLTVDENCIPRYRERLGTNVKLGVMPFAVQPGIHHPAANGPTLRRASFVGSYSHHVHDRRRAWQDMMFRAAKPLGLTAYDRNSDRRNANYRFPPLPWLDVKQSVPYEKTADIYREHMVSLNVNTVDDSPTMFSRRLVEIVACGGLAVTNPSPSVDRYFRDYCEVVHNEEECRAVFERLSKDGLSRRDRDRALAGADYVRQNHTWAHRIEQIMAVIG